MKTELIHVHRFQMLKLNFTFVFTTFQLANWQSPTDSEPNQELNILRKSEQMKILLKVAKAKLCSPQWRANSM